MMRNRIHIVAGKKIDVENIEAIVAFLAQPGAGSFADILVARAGDDRDSMALRP